jgi:segregation and condensation protein A
MAEKIAPWWRRALNYALDGIRSALGRFGRPAPPERQEKSVERLIATPEIQEKEAALTYESLQNDPVAAELELAVETTPEPQTELAAPAAATPGEAPVHEPEDPTGPPPAVDPEPQPDPEGDPEPEDEPANEPEPHAPPVKEPEPEPVHAEAAALDAPLDASAMVEPDESVAGEAEPAVETEAASSEQPAEGEALPAEPVLTPVEPAEPEIAEIAVVLTVVAEEEARQEHVEESGPADEPAVDISPAEAASAVQVAPVESADLPAQPDPIAEAQTAPEAAGPQGAPESAPPAKAPVKIESRDNLADLSPFSVVVDQVYDGPLDLLLDLIRKQDIDIYDIPISKITAQFLAYVNQLKATDVDVAGEFIYIASLLIHIKSKMLLPRLDGGPDDAAEDPRRELVERLLEHERFKNAAQMLQQKQMLEAATWSNPGFRDFKDDAAAEPEIAADTTDLVRIFRDILERARKRPVFNVDEDAVTVGQMIQFLARRLTMEDKPVALRRLLSHTRSERALIAMFLALLELVRMQAILLRQDRAFSEIFIKKHTGFDSVVNDGMASAQDDWR